MIVVLFATQYLARSRRVRRASVTDVVSSSEVVLLVSVQADKRLRPQFGNPVLYGFFIFATHQLFLYLLAVRRSRATIGGTYACHMNQMKTIRRLNRACHFIRAHVSHLLSKSRRNFRQFAPAQITTLQRMLIARFGECSRFERRTAIYFGEHSIGPFASCSNFIGR